MSPYLAIIDALNRADVSYVIVGGIATVLHGYQRFTSDVDIVVRLDAENAAKALDAAMASGYLPRPPLRPDDFTDPERRSRWIREKGMLVFTLFNTHNPAAGVDLFVDYPTDFQALFEKSVVKDVSGIATRICSMEDLITMKRKSGRPKDLEDVRQLEQLRDLS